MPAQATEKPRLDPRIHAWIDAIVPGTPEAPPPPQSRKRSAQRKDNDPRPAKRTTGRVLRSTAGNIMGSNQEKKNASPERMLRSSTRIVPATPGKAAKGGAQANAVADVDATPRAGRPGYMGKRPSKVLGSPPTLAKPAGADGLDALIAGPSSPAQVSEPSRDGNESPDKESYRSPSRATSSSRRSQSPSKRVDLCMAERNVHFPKLDGESARQAGGFLLNYAALRSIGQGFGVIPASLKKTVEGHVDKDDKPFPGCYIKNPDRMYNEYVWHEIVKIHNAASRCEMEGSNEATWNRKVHGPLLEIVVNDPKYGGAISCHDVTSAQIGPKDLYIKNLSGGVMGGKKVDFVVGLEPDDRLRRRICHELSLHPPESGSLNQTSQPSIRHVIIFFTLETKPPSTGGEQADVLLATWGYAGFTKLHQLLDTAGRGGEPLPVMPLLSAHGHHWNLSAMRETGGENHVLGKLLLGTTETIQGIFQLIKALDLLVHWGNTEYRRWYFTNVLGLP